MAKILSKSGDSLADAYDVQGSVAGIDELQSRDVNLVHEMGATIFSERVHGAIQAMSSAGVAQNATWNIEVLLPRVSRILNWVVFADVVSRVADAQLSLGDVAASNPIEVPFWSWDSVLDAERVVRLNFAGSVSQEIMLIPALPSGVPGQLLAFGTEQPDAGTAVQRLAFRGTTLGFGAGSVIVTALIYHALSAVTRPSSRGLPLPSW